MQLKIHDAVDYAVIKFLANTALPAAFEQITAFKSVTYTAEECSIIVPTGTIDCQKALAVDSGWFLLQIVGQLDFSLVGILTQIANPLAENGIPIFVVSTYNTDYVLLRTIHKQEALAVLLRAGHSF